MKKSFVILLCMLLSLCANAVTVTISEGTSDPLLKKRIEHNASVLLTEINRAQIRNSELDFTYVLQSLPKEVKESMGAGWEVSPFRCTKESLSVRLLNSSNGYQIRGIPILMTPNTGSFDEPKDQEAFIDFDREGRIKGFNIAIIQNQFEKIVSDFGNYSAADMAQRQIILDFLELYRQAWMMRDIDFIDMIYSDDAVIITGTVVHPGEKDGIKLPDVIKYNVKDKKAYMESLKRSFTKYDKVIKVIFDDIEIIQHPILKNYYGVTLKQDYFANGQRQKYQDVGYVFLLWQFPEEGDPVIHVRTWQPERINNKPLPEESKFSLNTFEESLW